MIPAVGSLSAGRFKTVGSLSTGRFKTVGSLSTGRFTQVGYHPEWTQILQNMVVLNPEGAVHLAQMLVNQDSAKVDLEAVADLFLQRNMVQQTTSFLLDALKNNKPEEGGLQTKLLEINLRAAPQVTAALTPALLCVPHSHSTARVSHLCALLSPRWLRQFSPTVL